MPNWENLFKKHGKVFTEPSQDMPKITQLFKKHHVKKVLDLGCGPGRHLVYLAKQGFETYGTDNSNTALEMAQTWLEKEQLTVHLKIGDFSKQLPYQDNFFDAIISNNTIHHGTTAIVKNAIQEITRIIKPNGLVFITVPTKNHKSTIQPEKRFKSEQIEARVFVPLEGPEQGVPHFFFTKKLIKEFFHDFTIQDLYIKDYNYCVIGIKK